MTKSMIVWTLTSQDIGHRVLMGQAFKILMTCNFEHLLHTKCCENQTYGIGVW